MKWLVLFILAGPVYGKAQSLKLREIHKGPVARCYCTTDSAFSYPIFGTGNGRVDSAINAQVRSQVLEADSAGYSLRKAVRATIKQGMSYLSYEITFRNANFLSIKMEGEWDGGAYPNPLEYEFNFDLKTGEELTIHDLFGDEQWAQVNAFVLADRKKFLDDYLAGEAADRNANEQDSVACDWAIGVAGECRLDTTSPGGILLTGSAVEFLDGCSFPHAIRDIQPDYSLKYSFGRLAPFLKPEFRRRLLAR